MCEWLWISDFQCCWCSLGLENMTCTLVFFRDTCTLILIGCGLFPAHRLEWAHLPCSGGHYPEGQKATWGCFAGGAANEWRMEQGGLEWARPGPAIPAPIPRFAQFSGISMHFQPIHQTRIAVSSYNPINIYKVVKWAVWQVSALSAGAGEASWMNLTADSPEQLPSSRSWQVPTPNWAEKGQAPEPVRTC